ncbi:MAG: endonuclease/exonuclease/phosphatase family protein [Bryobacterales bacterium]|nr:endonuclease/exonuclease/phosphatase family protein [Bryobacterales bacterium]
MRTPWGDLRVWNVHLDTRINLGERLDQLQPVIDEAAGYSCPRLIGGDFNTNDLYWFGNVLPLPFGPAHGTAVRSAMRTKGFETPLPAGLDTFKPFRRQLDWIYLNGLTSVAASVEPARFSDHNAVWVHARL